MQCEFGHRIVQRELLEHGRLRILLHMPSVLMILDLRDDHEIEQDRV
jgi:hypothetical protein